jgi:hypothetical protein
MALKKKLFDKLSDVGACDYTLRKLKSCKTPSQALSNLPYDDLAWLMRKIDYAAFKKIDDRPYRTFCKKREATWSAADGFEKRCKLWDAFVESTNYKLVDYILNWYEGL